MHYFKEINYFNQIEVKKEYFSNYQPQSYVFITKSFSDFSLFSEILVNDNSSIIVVEKKFDNNVEEE